MNVSLRAAGPEDSEFAYRVRRSAFREYREVWDEETERLAHADRFSRLPYRIVIWEGREVGVVVLTSSGDHYSLHQLFLLPEVHSKGIGGACMKIMFEEIAGSGLPVRLRVAKTNPRALAFYERLGFVVVGETETHSLAECLRS